MVFSVLLGLINDVMKAATCVQKLQTRSFLKAKHKKTETS